MTVTFMHLVGDLENLDKTIAKKITDDWVDTNTDNITPQILNGTDEPDYQAQFDGTGPNGILINTIEIDYVDNDDEVNSDTIHSVRETIFITIVAESRNMRIKIENEVNRIIWESNLNSINRLLKSNGTENSHLDHFEKSEITFKQIDLPDDESMSLQGSEGNLICIYYKFRT